MTVKQIRDRQRAIETQIDGHLAPGQDNVMANVWAQIEELTAEDKALEEQLSEAQAELQAQQAREENVAAYRTRRGTTAGRPTGQAGGGLTVAVSEPEWQKDRFAYGYRGPDGQPSARLFLLDVLRATMSGKESAPLQFLKPNREHMQLFAAAGSDEASGVSDPYGGYLVPMAFSPTLLSVGTEDDPTVGRTTGIPMSAPSVSIPARVDKDHTTSVTGGLRVFRRAETDTSASSRMEFEMVTLRANPLMGISFATEELLADSPISFVALIEAGFREEFGAKMLDERLNGTGAGQFAGVFNSPATIAITRAGANLIGYPDVVNMRARAWRYSGSIWLASHGTIPQLMQMVGAGTEIVWQPSIREDMPDLLLGRPVFFSEFVPDLGTQADLSITNWSQYLEGTYQALQNDESIHVRFEQNERTFRFTMRNDGQPWWRAPLTPRNAGPTLSPQVVLAA